MSTQGAATSRRGVPLARASMGLRFKFVVAIAFVLTVTLGGVAAMSTMSHQRHLKQSLDQKAHALGHFVALISAQPIYAFDITTLDRFVEEVSRDEDVRFAQIRNADDRPMTTFLPPGVTREEVEQRLAGSWEPDSVTEFVFPIEDDGAVLGKVVVALDFSTMNADVREALLTQVLTYVAIILFLALMIFHIFRASVLRPVNALMHGAGEAGKGNFDYRIDGMSADELGQLADCFNDMMSKMREDITRRIASEQKLQLAASVFTGAREGIVIAEADGTIIDVNEAFCRITGYAREEVLGETPRILKSGRHGDEFYRELWQQLADKGHWYGEIWNRRKDGDIFPELLKIGAVRDEDGAISHFVALFSDITAQKAYEQQLEHIAHFDALTNLPNRVLLADRLQQAMAQATRRRHQVAVAYIDLDGFKQINDSFGHEAGDRLLVMVSEQARGALRAGDTLARIGGDEFVAVLADINSPPDCVPLLERLLAAASQPVSVHGRMLSVSASVGVTFYPQDEEVDADQLLRQADQAMYQAKQAGRNRFHLFDLEHDRNVRGQYESVERIRLAMEQDELVLHYQPKVNMRTGEIVGFEALLRWQHPDRGMLLPGQFLPIIEDSPLSVGLGNWVLGRALAQMAAWQEQGLELSVSVNISARHLQSSSFQQDLRACLSRFPAVAPDRLQLEVLETSALEDIAAASRIMLGCKAMGVRFALDDFGTGYSSLTYLRRLPAEQLKVDFTFVRDMLDDPDDLALLEGVLGLATAFHRESVAEGVETVEHGIMLLRLGCELGQGFAIARPMPAGDVPAWIATWQPPESWRNQRVMGREYMPRMFAATEHRAWVRRLEAALRDDQTVPPPLAHTDCRFGHWLASVSAAEIDDDCDIGLLRDLHLEVHRIGTELLALKQSGRRAQALDRLPELREAGARMLAQLDRLDQLDGGPVSSA